MYEYLLVGEDEKHCILQLIFVQHAMQLTSGLCNTIPVVAIHDEDQGLSVQIVMTPEWSDPILATDVPNREIDVLVLDSFNIEAPG